jgi:phage N-6-adenine-methyltransferase
MSLDTDKTGASLNRGRSRQDYGTPWEFIRAVVDRFGPLDHDLAASEKNAKASTFYDEASDSISKDWGRAHPTGNLWLNPPFAYIEPWANKCEFESNRRHGLIFLLTPASIGTEWFAKYVHRKALVLALSPRLTFEGTDDPYPKDLMLSVYGYGMNGFDTWRWRA